MFKNLCGEHYKTLLKNKIDKLIKRLFLNKTSQSHQVVSFS